MTARKIYRLAAVFLSLAVVSIAAGCHASVTTGRRPGQLTRAFGRLVHADDGASVALPGGRLLYLMGDTTMISGDAICETSCPYGPAHSTAIVESVSSTGSITLRALYGRYGFGWQQIPNRQGGWVWTGGGAVYGSVLYVFGSLILPVPSCTGSWCWKDAGAEVTEFSLRPIRYRRTFWIGGSWTIDGAVRSGNFWFVFATSGTAKRGDVARVPLGALGSPWRWRWRRNIIPASLRPGSMISVVRHGSLWEAFTKQDDLLGNAIIRYTAGSPYGPWHRSGYWPIQPPAPGEWTYSVQAHPGAPGTPRGRILVSYAVGNGPDADYHLHFLSLPLS